MASTTDPRVEAGSFPGTLWVGINTRKGSVLLLFLPPVQSGRHVGKQTLKVNPHRFVSHQARRKAWRGGGGLNT